MPCRGVVAGRVEVLGVVVVGGGVDVPVRFVEIDGADDVFDRARRVGGGGGVVGATISRRRERQRVPTPGQDEDLLLGGEATVENGEELTGRPVRPACGRPGG